jgi:hypothetical protein
MTPVEFYELPGTSVAIAIYGQYLRRHLGVPNSLGWPEDGYTVELDPDAPAGKPERMPRVITYRLMLGDEPVAKWRDGRWWTPEEARALAAKRGIVSE